MIGLDATEVTYAPTAPSRKCWPPLPMAAGRVCSTPAELSSEAIGLLPRKAANIKLTGGTAATAETA